MKRTIIIGLFITTGTLWALAAWAGEPESKEPEKIRLLLITGRDVSAHDWRATTPVLREHLEKAENLEVMISEEPGVLESSALADYDIVLFNYYNHQRPGLTDKAKKNLRDFVAGGKGLISFHYSCRAFGDWPEFGKMIGRTWVGGKSGHGPRGEFDVTIKDKSHFITQGTSHFKADDELYAKLVGDEDIHVLVEAYSEWSEKIEPLAWTLSYGKGRVFNIVLGHDVKACKDPNFGRLLRRGALWAGYADKQPALKRQSGS